MGWGSGNLGGAGGGLNFVVKQYTETPTGTAKENTIAVVTDTAITSWVMSAEQPEGVEGLVWIEVAAASDVAFFADKKQQVKLYPLSVSQYVGDAWGKRAAWVYQSGAWVQFSKELFMLFDNGDQCTSITGGWGTGGYNTAHTETITSVISLSAGPQAAVASRSTASTKEAIDLTNITTLNCKLDGLTGGRFYLFLRDEYAPNTNGVGETYAQTTTAGTVSLDVSSVNGAKYVCVQVFTVSNGAGAYKATVSEIWGVEK